MWGEVASVKGVPFALSAAAAGALIGMALTWRWKLQTGTPLDLSPSMRWRAPSFLNRVPDDQGPILAIAEYRIDPKDSAAFLAVMRDIGLERRRDGAYAWHIFEDPDEAGMMTETYLVHSALELKYRQTRVTMADQMMEDQAAQFLKAPPQTRYLVAPQRQPPAVAEAYRRPRGAAPGLRSVVPRDRPVVGRLAIRQIEHHFVDVAPPPALGRIVAFDDRMAGGVKMLGRMPVRRLVATPDMSAGAAEPRWSQTSPVLRHSSQPSALGVTSRMVVQMDAGLRHRELARLR